jgi:nucleoside transporter
MSGALRLRLSALMFLQYAALGSWCVTFPSLLRALPNYGGLNLSGQQVGWLYATFAIAAILSPLIAGLMADTLFSTQRVLAVLHVACAALLILLFHECLSYRGEVDLVFRKLAFVEPAGSEELWHHLWERESIELYLELPGSPPPAVRQIPSYIARPLNWLGLYPVRMGDTSFVGHWNSPAEASARLEVLNRELGPALERIRQHPELIAQRDRAFMPLFWLLLVYNLCYLPSVTLANSVCFRNLPDPERQFGQARVFGTVGWIAALVLVGWSLPPISPAPLALAAIISLLLAAVCLILPHTPPLAQPRTFADWIGWPAFRAIADRSFLIFLLSASLCSVFVAFHNVFTNPFLVDLHIGHPAAVQAIGQLTEIGGILLIPRLRGRLGFRWLLTLGLVCSALRFVGYASCSVPWVIGLGLPMHGLGFSLFYITAAIYVDLRARGDMRASAQGLVTQVTSGIGAFVGTILSGLAVDRFTESGSVDWRAVWLIPAIGTVGLAMMFAAVFRDRPAASKMEPACSA